jgi:hypothetical protein
MLSSDENGSRVHRFHYMRGGAISLFFCGTVHVRRLDSGAAYRSGSLLQFRRRRIRFIP